MEPDKVVEVEESQFWVKTINKDEKEVQLNTKYTVKNDYQFFDFLQFIVELIQQKNKRINKEFHDAFDVSFYSSMQFVLGKCKMQEQKCMICLEQFQIKQIEKEAMFDTDEDIYALQCSHKYHKICLIQMIGQKKWAKCPICSTIFGKMTGDQPQGTMAVNIDKNLACQGYPKGTITINYHLKGGSRNGVAYGGTSRTAYLPDNEEGKEVLELLKEAFNRKLTFTVGRSVTTGMDNQTVWNGIHHKTSVSGGTPSFGFPDPTYMKRVKEELACKGIKSKKHHH